MRQATFAQIGEKTNYGDESLKWPRWVPKKRLHDWSTGSRYNLIVVIYSQGPVQHYIRVSETIAVIWSFNNLLNSNFGRNSQIGPWEIIFFSAQRFSVQNLQSTKAVKVFKTGISIFVRRVLVCKILHNKRLKIQCRRSASPTAWELRKKDHNAGPSHGVSSLCRGQICPAENFSAV